MLLFDQYINGHTATYLERFGRHLERAGAEVVVSAPDETVAALEASGIHCVPSGPADDWRLPGQVASEERRVILLRELEFLALVSEQHGIDHVVHLYADHILPEWAQWPGSLPPSTVVLFRLAAHYAPEDIAQMSPEGADDVARLDEALARWSRRPEAHAVMTLDPYSVDDLAKRHGIDASWLPEPKVEQTVETAPARAGAILYGMLSPRKGLDRLAEAVVSRSVTGPFRLLGHVHRPEYAAMVEGHADRMRSAGARVVVELERPSDEAALRALARARCVVLPYRAHRGMSRVLVEACSVGTPVIVHDFGLLARVVREEGLGTVVDCDDGAALGAALERMLGHEDEWLATSDRCRRLAHAISDPPLEVVLEAAVLGERGSAGPAHPISGSRTSIV